MIAVARPYVAEFSARFLQLLQYRGAAIAGFLTQCWWGSIKVMVYAAFYGANVAAAASTTMSLSDVIAYTWLAQAFFTMLPYGVDPGVATAVRSGSVALDRIRPVDTYALWYSRTLAWMTSRAVPRSALMLILAGFILPVVGLDAWALRPPSSLSSALLFGASLLLAAALSAATVMLLNVATVITGTDRGVGAMAGPFVFMLSGNLLPLALFPEAFRRVAIVQPFAGLVDIPMSIYTGTLTGTRAFGGLALQIFWTVVIVGLGRRWLSRAMQRLEVQGG